MKDEILNIEYHVKIMVLKALNRTDNNNDACKLLGISVRTLFRYKISFNIIYDDINNNFYIRQPIIVNARKN